MAQKNVRFIRKNGRIIPIHTSMSNDGKSFSRRIGKSIEIQAGSDMQKANATHRKSVNFGSTIGSVAGLGAAYATKNRSVVGLALGFTSGSLVGGYLGDRVGRKVAGGRLKDKYGKMTLAAVKRAAAAPKKTGLK